MGPLKNKTVLKGDTIFVPLYQVSHDLSQAPSIISTVIFGNTYTYSSKYTAFIWIQLVLVI